MSDVIIANAVRIMGAAQERAAVMKQLRTAQAPRRIEITVDSAWMQITGPAL
jgi:hypothetical protein